MRQISLTLDPHPQTKKPQKEEIATISKRIALFQFEGQFQEFAQKIAEQGFTWTPAIFSCSPISGKPERKNTLFKQAELIGLDFDGGLEYQEIIERSRTLNLYPNLIHESFSSTTEIKKYRVIFVLDKPYQSQQEFVCRIRRLLEHFPEADKATKDPARLFFGSNKGILYLDVDNYNTIKPVDLKFNVNTPSTTLGANLFEQGVEWGDFSSSHKVFKKTPAKHQQFVAQQFYVAKQRISNLSWDNPTETGYQVIKEETIRLAGIAGVTGWLIHKEFSHAVSLNQEFFRRWNYNLEEVIRSNFQWKSDRPDIRANGKFQVGKSYSSSKKFIIVVKFCHHLQS